MVLCPHSPMYLHECRDCSVGTATGYKQDGLEIEYRCSGTSCIRPDRPWGPPSPLYCGYRVSLPAVKWPGRGVDHPPTSSVEVKERVELYIYSSSVSSRTVLGRPLPYMPPWHGQGRALHFPQPYLWMWQVPTARTVDSGQWICSNAERRVKLGLSVRQL
jgi:hypothetical protein